MWLTAHLMDEWDVVSQDADGRIASDLEFRRMKGGRSAKRALEL